MLKISTKKTIKHPNLLNEGLRDDLNFLLNDIKAVIKFTPFYKEYPLNQGEFDKYVRVNQERGNQIAKEIANSAPKAAERLDETVLLLESLMGEIQKTIPSKFHETKNIFLKLSEIVKSFREIQEKDLQILNVPNVALGALKRVVLKYNKAANDLKICFQDAKIIGGSSLEDEIPTQVIPQGDTQRKEILKARDVDPTRYGVQKFDATEKKPFDKNGQHRTF
jgi:hypothetical protein